MKHSILISAGCIFALLLLRYTDKKKIAGLEAANQALRAEIRKSHRPPVNVKKTPGAKKSRKIGQAKSRGKHAV